MKFPIMLCLFVFFIYTLSFGTCNEVPKHASCTESWNGFKCKCEEGYYLKDKPTSSWKKTFKPGENSCTVSYCSKQGSCGENSFCSDFDESCKCDKTFKTSTGGDSFQPGDGTKCISVCGENQVASKYTAMPMCKCKNGGEYFAPGEVTCDITTDSTCIKKNTGCEGLNIGKPIATDTLEECIALCKDNPKCKAVGYGNRKLCHLKHDEPKMHNKKRNVCVYMSCYETVAPVEPEVEEVEDCIIDHAGNDYAGSVSKTKSGLDCQRWDSQTPHSHGANMDVPGGENYCRNPDNEPEGPWCYTMDVSKRWEYCEITICST